jgi:hypothetical protein
MGAKTDRLLFSQLPTTKVLGLTTVILMLVAIPPAFADDSTSCQLAPGESISVCFANPPLQVTHCNGTISPEFQISRKGNAPYAFSYRVYADLGNGDFPFPDQSIIAGEDTNGHKYLLTDENAVGQLPTNYLAVPFRGDGSYYIEVAVRAQGLPPVTLTSSPVVLHDAPLIKSIVVGISHYDKGSDNTAGQSIVNLLHADSDAKAFAAMLAQLFPDSPPPVRMTSDDTALPPTVDNIMGELTQAEKDPGLCSDNDWFIFYFSGHGVLGSDGRNIRHYVSTKTLDPSDLPSTAIWIGELLPKIEKIRAGNKLVVLDSCFSGSSRTPDPSLGGNEGRGIRVLHKSSKQSSKVEFVINGKPVNAFQVVNDPDSYAPITFTTNVDHAQGRALFVAAAKANHEAEEGFEQVTPSGIVFTPSDTESEEQKQFGHGLYTFSLIWRLESQLPRASVYKEVLTADQGLLSDADECALNFVAAHQKVTAEFVDKVTKASGLEVQQPDFNKTPEDLPSVRCKLPPAARNQNGQPHP